jgi:hypothetical protein
MTMVPRDPIIVKQIEEAKQGVPGGDLSEEVTQESVDAQQGAKGTAGAPARLPMVKK